MFPVFLAQWMKEKRSPYLVLIFCGISIAATLLFGINTTSKMKIDVFSDEKLTKAAVTAWIDQLNQSEAFKFKLRDERQARLDVREGRADVAVRLLTEDYRIIAAVDSPNVQLVEKHVHRVFEKELLLRSAANRSDDQSKFRQDVNRYLQSPPFTLQTQSSDGRNIVRYDMGLQYLFGFTLFLVIFTIGFKVNAITVEQTSGIWNRMILSPLRKTEIYLGHLFYSFLIGFSQIVVVFLIFLYGFGFHIREHFGMLLVIAAIYTLTMVAFAMLFTGILRTPEKFNAIFPSMLPIMPMLSGVYVPPGTITNNFFLAVAQAFPLTHALEALIGIAVYDENWLDVFMPIAKLLLLGVIFMGVGINLMERQKA
jgi:ABC-2 type transport system permease protein